jgi:hypothetical protein
MGGHCVLERLLSDEGAEFGHSPLEIGGECDGNGVEHGLVCSPVPGRLELLRRLVGELRVAWHTHFLGDERLG